MSDTIKFPLAALEQLCNEIDTSASDEIERLTRERDESKNKLADALQEVDLRTLDFERMKKERDKARENATNYYAKIGELTDNFLFLQREAFEMREAIIATLEENRHLADGDDCTLAKLKLVVPDWE